MDNTTKFSDKVEVYRQYRPSYPDAFVHYLFDEVGISQDACVADIGAGTGILTEILSEHVKTVYAIEPDRNMRIACMDTCGRSCAFVALEGRAESTGLPDQCLDFITVAQAFHWFEPHRTQLEFSRVLKPDGMVILVWNSRVPDAPLTIAWDAVCRKHCPNFTGFSNDSVMSESQVHDFFRDGICETRQYPNNRLLDLASFLGTALSASYAPVFGQPAYDSFVTALTQLFWEHATGEKILVPMYTHSYVGRI